MFAPSHFHSHYFDDGCSTDEFIDAEVKVDLQHVEFKGLRLSSLPPPLHHHHLGSDPMSIVDPMLEEDGDQMLEDADLADYAYATGFGGGLVGATNNIEVLPNEVFVLIFSYLDSRELLTVASTCHRWRHLAEGTLSLRCCSAEARPNSFPWALFNRGDSVEAGGGARLPLA
jgi:hypothetical protein